MTAKSKKTVLGFTAAVLSVFSKKLKPTVEDFHKLEFKTSTQRMGIGFTEKIRNTFRFKWIKKR